MHTSISACAFKVESSSLSFFANIMHAFATFLNIPNSHKETIPVTKFRRPCHQSYRSLCASFHSAPWRYSLARSRSVLYIGMTNPLLSHDSLPLATIGKCLTAVSHLPYLAAQSLCAATFHKYSRADVTRSDGCESVLIPALALQRINTLLYVVSYIFSPGTLKMSLST